MMKQQLPNYVGASLTAVFLMILSFCNSCIDKAAISTVDLPIDTVLVHHHELPDAHFPDDWIGNYQGSMEWSTNGISKGYIPIQIKVAPIDSLENTWHWQTIYDSTEIFPQKVVKDYWIVKPDSSKEAHYIMDELNGIQLNMYLQDNCFYSSFSVAGNRILAMDRLAGGKIYHEIIMTPTQGGDWSTAVENKDTFNVNSSNQLIVQKAVLSLME